VQVSHTFGPDSAVFDEDNLVSCAGLVPVIALAEQSGLSELLDNKIHIAAPRIKSGSANPAPKLATLIASMCAGGDYIDDVDLVRAGGMKTLFHRVYAPSTVGTLLREFTFGHARQLDSVLAEHLAGLCERVDLLPGSGVRAFVDIDSLVRPVYGHGQTGRLLRAHQDLRKTGPPQRALTTGHHLEHRHRATGSHRDPATRRESQLRQRRSPHGRPGHYHRPRGRSHRADHRARRQRLRFGRGDPHLPALRGGVLPGAGPQRGGATRDRRDLPGRLDPRAVPGCGARSETGAWISDAEVAETTYTMAESGTTAITARLIVRRVKDANQPDGLFPISRYHPFFTNFTEPATAADITHRRHAIIETTFADLIDGPLAHIPSGRFGANSAWAICAAIAHNLLRGAAALAGTRHRSARGATLRRHLVNIPARLARPQRKPILHLPRHWPWEPAWTTLWHNTIGHRSSA
jgi:hypothetical protein